MSRRRIKTFINESDDEINEFLKSVNEIGFVDIAHVFDGEMINTYTTVLFKEKKDETK